MSVRDPKVPVRRQAVQRRDPRLASGGAPRGPRASQVLVAGLFALMLVGTGAFVFGALNAEPLRSPPPSGAAVDPTDPSGTPGLTGAPGSSADPAASPSPSGEPSGSPVPGATPGSSDAPPSLPPGTVEVAMPVVPVVGFWRMHPDLSLTDLTAALEGRSERYDTVLVPAEDRNAIASALGVTLGASVQDASPGEILTTVRDGSLGLLRAADVTARVRALGLEDRQLFGNDRVRSNRQWPLTIPVAEPPERAWDQADLVTIVAGGDSMMDRGIYERVVNRDRGISYPLDGGTIEITGRYCCGSFTGLGAYEVPEWRKTGNEGLVRAKLVDADLAIINLENPTPDNWVFHLHGTPFSGKPALLEIFTSSGVDWVSLANNHIYDFGPSGIEDTLKHLRRFGLEWSGAGMDLEEAREYSIMEAGSSTVALLPCVSITPIVWATDDRAGGMPCQDDQMLPNIREAAELADIVIVFPHWGLEYVVVPQEGQRTFAERWLNAGADIVIGGGTHTVGGMEDVDGKLAFYSIGNFVFDQNWAEFTMQGILPEMTWAGGELKQVALNPFLAIDQAQPNFLDPAADGRVVMKRIQRGSEGLLDY